MKIEKKKNFKIITKIFMFVENHNLFFNKILFKIIENKKIKKLNFKFKNIKFY